MNNKTAILTALLLATAAFLAIPNATAEPTTFCAVENIGCYCLDSSNYQCDGLATTECIAAVGVNPDLMVGLDCKHTPLT